MEGLLQRQPLEEEEELLQTKPVDREAAPPDLRRQIEDEDDQVRGKSIDGRILPAACADCEEERVDRQMPAENGAKGKNPRYADGSSAVGSDLESRIRRLKTGGQPLDNTTRHFFEARLGRDFSQVRLHTGREAGDIANSLNARAFTLGHHIAMGRGEYRPRTSPGMRLLGHELAHVIQQSERQVTIDSRPSPTRSPATTESGDLRPVIRRNLFDDIRERAEAFGTERLRELAEKPVGTGGWTSTNPDCPANFCKPFANEREALADLAWAGPMILAGIATKVNSRVVPLWATYLAGGDDLEDFSDRFGTDFTNSPTTAETTRFLVGELQSLVERDHAALMGGAPSVTVDVSNHLEDARIAINTSKGDRAMNFTFPTDIAGNIAGGIGDNQADEQFGANPSEDDDSRAARITATLVRDAAGTITVTPSIRFRVHDTIDLCPGNCGNDDEKVATVPLSRFEATHLVGDVPFFIDFDAPAAELASFTVTPSTAVAPPAAIRGVVTASSLRYRAAPDTSAAILGHYPRGTDVALLCQTTGTVVLGEDTWYQTADGFVSGRYVALMGPGPPPAC